MATVRVQLRRGTEQQWYDANPVLAAGEVGIETDTNTFKFGDGSTAWNSLSYALSDTVDDYILLSTKGVANGVASLDSSGFIPSAQLPPLAKVTVSAVANQAARLALTAESGDIAIQSDTGTTYVLSASPASTDGNWKVISATAAISAAIATHEADTTAVHGIADTSLLATTANVATAKTEAISAAASAAGTALSTHEADTTAVHGIANTSLLATTANVATAKSEAISAAATDATAKANSAIDTAASDATTKANTAQAAAVANTTTQINNLINSAPGTLDTLGEIATALAADESAATALTTLVNTKAPLASPTFTGTVTIPSGASISGFAPLSSPTFTGVVTIPSGASISGFARLAAPTFTGTVTLPESTSIGNVSNQEISYLDGVTSTVQGQIDAKLASATAASTYAPLASPTLTGTVTLPESTSIGNVSNLEIGYVNGVTSSIQTQIDAKLASATAASTYAPLASPTLTGTVTLPESTSIGNVSNLEIGYVNGVTSGIQTQLDAKQAVVANVSDVEIGYLDGVTSAIQTQLNTKQPVVANVSDVEIGHLDGVTSGIQGQIDLKAPLASPTFTGTVTLPALTVSSSMLAADAVTSGKIANGTIINEDISASAEIATSKISGLDTALGLKAPLASPTFTGTVTLPAGTITTGMILDGTIADADINAAAAIAQSKISGLTSDLSNKLSSATAASTYAPLASPTLTGVPVAPTAAAATNTTQIATTAYVRAEVAALVNSAGATLDTLGEIATALGNDANLSTTLTTAIALKAPLASPTFTGTNTVANITVSGTSNMSANGVQFSDGTQTKAGVPSLTTIGTTISAAYNLSTGGLTLRDQLIPISGTYVVTVPTNATTAFPVGTSIDFYQSAGTVASFAGAVGVTINATPGLKLRTTYSSATLTKVATDTWLLAGDLTA